MSRIPRRFDKRVKLAEWQRREIREIGKREEAINMSQLAREYGVSRRTIDFILHPEKLETNRALMKKRGGSAQYYDRTAHTEATRRYRAHIKELAERGLIA